MIDHALPDKPVLLMNPLNDWKSEKESIFILSFAAAAPKFKIIYPAGTWV